MKIQFNYFPGGRTKALTMSYDDGRDQDRRLVQIMNDNGLKGSFHLNSGLLGKPNYVTTEEVGSLYAGHEVSAHTVNHPFLDQTPGEHCVTEIMDDRRSLEQLTGYPVRGMSYPFGVYDEDVLKLLPTLGIQYSRTTKSTGAFDMPKKPLEWGPTCHHKDMIQLGEAFLNFQTPSWRTKMSLLYVWGHSYEFDNDNNWDKIETFGRMMSGHEEIWYATNIEIIDYMNATKRLQFSVDGTIVSNPNAISIWIGVMGNAIEIKPGEIKRLSEE